MLTKETRINNKFDELFSSNLELIMSSEGKNNRALTTCLECIDNIHTEYRVIIAAEYLHILSQSLQVAHGQQYIRNLEE